MGARRVGVSEARRVRTRGDPVELTIDTPAADLARLRIADLETMVSLLEERLASEQTERRRLEQLLETCCADRGRLQRVVVEEDGGRD